MTFATWSVRSESSPWSTSSVNRFAGRWAFRVAESVHGDGLTAMVSGGFDPSVEGIQTVLREAW